MEKEKIIEDLINKIDTLVGYLQSNILPDREIREGIVEEWKQDKLNYFK